jgi:2'-5' RNA ligase
MLQDSAQADFGSVHVESVDLMRSDLRPGGPLYSRLAALALSAAGMGSS